MGSFTTGPDNARPERGNLSDVYYSSDHNRVYICIEPDPRGHGFLFLTVGDIVAGQFLKRMTLSGVPGQPGPQGAQGERGTTGTPGPQGPSGAAGVTGERGATGERGERGDAGYSPSIEEIVQAVLAELLKVKSADALAADGHQAMILETKQRAAELARHLRKL